MIRKLCFCFLTLTTFSAAAQHTYNHGVFWGRLALADRITDKWKWEVYLQKRTQNIPHEKSIFGATHYNSAWLWLNFSFNKSLRLSLSPFGYFDSYAFLTNPEDVDRPGVKEFRWAARLDQEQKLKWLNFVNRYGIEYRRRDLNQNDVYLPNWRLRYQARLEKPVFCLLNKKKPVLFFITEEVFIQFGKAVRANPNVFDQNRISLGASYEVVKNIRTSLSYLNIIQERINGKDFDNAHSVWIIVTFDNLISQFVKR